MNEQNDKTIFDLNLDEEGKSHLASVAQWANINAIVSFVALGISVISTIVALGKVSRYSSDVAGGGVGTLFVSVGISLLVNILLFTSATNIKKGLEQNNQGFFNVGITKLATYFKVVGIIAIVSIILAVLFILFIAMMGFGR
jgi:Family of unknown function (DUF5362)